MIKTTKTATAPKAFGMAAYKTLTGKVVSSALSTDIVVAATNKLSAPWIVAVATGILSGALTMDSVSLTLRACVGDGRRQSISERYKKIGVSCQSDSIKACGATIEGMYRALNKVAKANQLGRLASGEALYTVARSIAGADTAASAAKQREATKAKAKGRAPKQDTALADSSDRVKAALSFTIGEAIAMVVSEGKAGKLTAAQMTALTTALVACKTAREAKARNVASSAAKENAEKIKLAA